MTAVGGSSSTMRVVKGPAWTVNVGGSMNQTVSPLGQAVYFNSNGYYNRANALSSGGLTVGICWTPTYVNTSGSAGVWSIAAAYLSSSTYILLQANNSDLRLFCGGGYQITYSGLLVVGVPLKIAIGITNIATSAASTVYLCVNGVLKQATVANNGTNAATNEFLGSGYNGQSAGNFSDFFSANVCYPPELLQKLSSNPWQIFAP